MSDSLLVSELVDRYLEHAESYYRRSDGSPSREHLNLKSTLSRLSGGWGQVLAGELTKEHLKAYRDKMIEDGRARTYINKAMRHIQRCWQWGAEEDLVDPSTLMIFKTIKPLQRFRSQARETNERDPVPDEIVDATLPFLPPVPAASVQLLRLTGSRISELLVLCQGDVVPDEEREGIWWVMPTIHKTAWQGKRKIIPFDTECIGVLERYDLWRPLAPEDPIFRSPRRPGRSATYDYIRNSINRACEQAGVQRWTTHQVRHNVATTVNRLVGKEHARALLGHSSSQTTDIYLHEDRELILAAQRAARESRARNSPRRHRPLPDTNSSNPQT